ncbi:CWF19-like protein 2 isoform X1 [Cucurbita moschata]|uniref:CWF19-like protein 2 isoform X1 n=1 Tax=Cucurbita moschata TaxID=3662 RepID=A0A6J1G3U6_CUCMO|nr:CWF19-like protein 2 isoform X1 [Cucurbita moschata]XP_022946471.1 CWF19-like protein 2 isoform X1 [Cucurbita moschata]XP_022946472.1 CWF19-like protein 2 isoform X1 [Cucurbita moschata]
MLSGVKFIPRERISDSNEKQKSKGKSTRYSSSDEEYQNTKKKKFGRKKSSKDYSTSSTDSDMREDSHRDRKKHRTRKASKRNKNNSSSDENDDRVKRKSRNDRNTLAREYSTSTDTDDSSSDSVEKLRKHRRQGERNRDKKRKSRHLGEEMFDSIRETSSKDDKEIVRKEMGLEWMLKPQETMERISDESIDNQQEEAPKEITKVNPRELNPYFKDNGTGYPEESDRTKSDIDKLPPPRIVGDGGASWRLKALKRAEEQAARDGRRLEEVVEERWGSLGQLAVSVAARKVAPSRSHLHAIRNRKRGLTSEDQVSNSQNESDSGKSSARDYLKDISSRHPEMREPKVRDSLSWGKQKSQNVSSKDAGFISLAVTSINKFSDDGSFASDFLRQQSENTKGDPVKTKTQSQLVVSTSDKPNEDCVSAKDAMSANQLAAKAFQLQMKGKHEEAQMLLQEVQTMKATNSVEVNSIKPQIEQTTSRKHIPGIPRRNKADDTDLYLAKSIMKNKQYSMSGRADNEYDYEDGSGKTTQRKRGSNDDKLSGRDIRPRRMATQEERCIFCFENPNRPKHLTVSIANCTYLMLPQWQPVVTGHCCILPISHESATRSVEKTVWEEIRNFKKCLIMMFAKQEKDVVFLETVVGLAKQRRHCLIECIPLPQGIAKEAPLYFKKAIDEAEEEWSQHNAKKLIDTSVKGLRGSIPENFPYFHVEFGLNKGFVHVIDDEDNFKTSFGLNVIRGMLQLAEEDMHRRRRYESVEVQKQAVANFLQDWEPFDWTKQL